MTHLLITPPADRAACPAVPAGSVLRGCAAGEAAPQQVTPRLIETDRFPFEFVSLVAERESWRKEIHRPIYHVHKWWAKRLGSVFRAILLGCVLPEGGDLEDAFHAPASFPGVSVLDPFLGSGTTAGEAHKLGMTALGRDINPVAVEAVRTAFGPLHVGRLEKAFAELSQTVGGRVRTLYQACDSAGATCDVLYYFWAMQAPCPQCHENMDLLSSWVIARNAYPDRKPEVQILCPRCGDIFPGRNGDAEACCRSCGLRFAPEAGPASGAKVTCTHCQNTFRILDALGRNAARPGFRLYGKLILTRAGAKQYLAATPEDQAAYDSCAALLDEEERAGRIVLPGLRLEGGHNTAQAMGYGFRGWRDFFNDRQLLALGWLRAGIADVPDVEARGALLTLFSGVLEFNNLFASYKGEGTGAVRHMFAHHVLKPERAPIEANVWGTPKSSGSFSGLYKGRLLRALAYRQRPSEVGGEGRPSAAPFTGRVEATWPTSGRLDARGLYLSCGDSADTGLPCGSLDLVVTDPPFFDNVHYSELADFFYAWQQLGAAEGVEGRSTRDAREVQDADSGAFTRKLRDVLAECRRVLKDDGLVVFSYHHSRDAGWRAVGEAILGAGLVVVNSHPVKAEMAGATPKSQTKEPIQLDIVIICRKQGRDPSEVPTRVDAAAIAREKLRRLEVAGFTLSRNDRRIVVYGQLLTALRCLEDAATVAGLVEEISAPG